MPELFREMYYGPNVQNLVESDDCKVMRLSDNSGEGMMTLYHVFPGVFLMYNDFHMKECISGFQTDMDLLCIDHCREGRIEQEVGQNAFSYLEAGDLRVDRRIHHSGKVEFPLSHYHGISIGFQMETAAKEIPASMKDFSVDLYELQKKYCSDRTPYVIPGEPAIEHIFSELYNVPVKIKKDYFKIKVLELLLYLDALELSGHTEERPYFYKGQVEKIKAIQALLTQDLTKNYTLEELSARFDIALTPMKNCFKSVYGSPIFTYMRNYRMNYAASLLKSDKSLKVAEIAGLVGYDSPSKFAPGLSFPYPSSKLMPPHTPRPPPSAITSVCSTSIVELKNVMAFLLCFSHKEKPLRYGRLNASHLTGRARGCRRTRLAL